MRTWQRAWMAASVLILASACTGVNAPRADTPDTPRLEAEAARGGAESALRLGRHYAAHDDSRATRWYRRAAAHRPVDRWVALAEFELGRIAGSGRIDPDRRDAARAGSGPNLPRARRWMQRSAGHGLELAMMWHVVDAEADHAPLAQARWNLRYGMTQGDLFMLARVRDRLREADDGGTLARIVQRTRDDAARGDPEALVDLGMLHHLGLGMEQDHAQALARFEDAARAGNVFGMHFAGLVIARGYLPDVPAEDAGAWFDAAYARGFYPAGKDRPSRLDLPEFSR